MSDLGKSTVIGLLAALAAGLTPALILGTTGQTILTHTTLDVAAAHDVHADEGVACTTCHGNALTSTRSSDLLLPASTLCAPCHLQASCEGDIVKACEKCHEGPPRSLLTERFRHAKRVAIVFDHSAHASNATCATCHPMDGQGSSGEPALPSMPLCIKCHPHEQAWEADQCSPCHLETKMGTIKTDLPGALLVPPGWMHGAEHDGSFLTDHAAAAAARPGLCAACHLETDCAACHAGKVKPAAIHPGDWIQFHPVSSALGKLRCSSCHSYQSFCVTCHRKTGVAWDSPSTLGVPSGNVFHPEGWSSLSGQSKHAKQAKKNLMGCVSCHTESDCIACHSASALIPVSPHPSTGSWHVQCKALAKKNKAACLKCHPTVPPVCL